MLRSVLSSALPRRAPAGRPRKHDHPHDGNSRCASTARRVPTAPRDRADSNPMTMPCVTAWSAAGYPDRDRGMSRECV